ncbi:MAG TPA: carboxypeptidase-like regulatory domain-containing protein [Pirellulaceae bacterium]|nr:carboxypeptidase-like regulatory domain-containing protein [Pirellulaceae bacterium]
MGSIQGTVTRKSGRLPPEVAVLIDSGPPHPDIAALADATGRFSLTGLSNGEYIISAYVDGVRQATERVHIRGNEPAEVQLVLDAPL